MSNDISLQRNPEANDSYWPTEGLVRIFNTDDREIARIPIDLLSLASDGDEAVPPSGVERIGDDELVLVPKWWSLVDLLLPESRWR